MYETSSNYSHEVRCDKPEKVLFKPSYSNSSEVIDTNTDITWYDDPQVIDTNTDITWYDDPQVIDTNTDITWYDDPQVKVTSQANYNSQHKTFSGLSHLTS
jgi:hypothetical protein